MLQLGLNLSTKESDLWKLTAERSRLQLLINDLDSRLSQAEQSKKDQILADLSIVQQNLFDTDVALPSAIAQRATRFRNVGHSLDQQPGYQTTITRVGSKGDQTFIATDTTRLEPGDIVEIRLAVQNLDQIEGGWPMRHAQRKKTFTPARAPQDRGAIAPETIGKPVTGPTVTSGPPSNANTVPSEEGASTLELRLIHLVRTFWSYHKLIALCLAAGMALGVLVALVMGPTYTATAILQPSLVSELPAKGVQAPVLDAGMLLESEI